MLKGEKDLKSHVRSDLWHLWQDDVVIFSVWLDHEMHPDKTDQLTEVSNLLCFVEYVLLMKKI